MGGSLIPQRFDEIDGGGAEMADAITGVRD
jgi:hypothetical protein